MRTAGGRIRELTKLPQRAVFGYLAEDYDGIGQYVMVSLARSSTAAAYKARIAAGDFGGGRIFPAGTKVPVFSIRGRLEVLLGNHPSDLCIEDFNRFETLGWGKPEFPSLTASPDWRHTNGVSGDPWYRQGWGDYYSVVDGRGIIDVQAVQQNDPWIWFFPDGNPTSFEFPAEYLIKFRMEDMTQIGTARPQLDLYLSDSEKIGNIGTIGNTFFVTLDYSGSPPNRLPRLRVGIQGNIDGTGPGLSYGTIYQEHVFSNTAFWQGQDLFIRWKVDINTFMVMARAWLASEAEPGDWQALAEFEDFQNWRGLRAFIVGAYKTSKINPFENIETLYKFDHIKDVNGSLCGMNGTDFVPIF